MGSGACLAPISRPGHIALPVINNSSLSSIIECDKFVYQIERVFEVRYFISVCFHCFTKQVGEYSHVLAGSNFDAIRRIPHRKILETLLLRSEKLPVGTAYDRVRNLFAFPIYLFCLCDLLLIQGD